MRQLDQRDQDAKDENLDHRPWVRQLKRAEHAGEAGRAIPQMQR